MTDVLREHLDTYYFAKGPCCAGCDWWHALNSSVGECRKTAPMSGQERLAMVGMDNCTLQVGAGHALTAAGHHCGEFKDEFDWSSLPPHYLRKIGARRRV